MKRLNFLLVVLLAPLLLGAVKPIGLTSKAGQSAVVSYTVQDIYPTTVANQLKVGSASGTQHAASYMDCGNQGGTAPYNLTKILQKLRKVGSPTFNINISIRANTGSELPSSTITVASVQIAASSLSTSFADVTWLVASTGLTAGQIVWIAIDCDGFVDTNNCVEWQDTSNTPFDSFARTYSRTSADGTTWAGGDNTVRTIAFYSTP